MVQHKVRVKGNSAVFSYSGAHVEQIVPMVLLWVSLVKGIRQTIRSEFSTHRNIQLRNSQEYIFSDHENIRFFLQARLKSKCLNIDWRIGGSLGTADWRAKDVYYCWCLVSIYMPSWSLTMRRYLTCLQGTTQTEPQRTWQINPWSQAPRPRSKVWHTFTAQQGKFSVQGSWQAVHYG
jgi:hypothetical protein